MEIHIFIVYIQIFQEYKQSLHQKMSQSLRENLNVVISRNQFFYHLVQPMATTRWTRWVAWFVPTEIFGTVNNWSTIIESILSTFHCNLCEKCFYPGYSFIYHITSMHGQILNKMCNQMDQPVLISNIFKCLHLSYFDLNKIALG